MGIVHAFFFEEKIILCQRLTTHVLANMYQMQG